MKDNIGFIYVINCKVNNKNYVGCSTNISQRWEQHRSNLRGNTHTNKELQEDYNKYGESNFEFNVVNVSVKSELLNIEEYYILKLKANDSNFGYNKSINNSYKFTEEQKELIRRETIKALNERKAQSIKLGRPRIHKEGLPPKFDHYMKLLASKQIKKIQLAEHLGISRPTLDRYIKVYNESHSS